MANTQPAVAGRSRSIYTAVNENYNRRYGKGAVTITQSYLRLESATLGTQGTINFAVLKNEIAQGATSVNATENRLNLTDNFLATECGIYIQKTTTSTQTTNNSYLDTFPNSLVYAKTGEAIALQTIYNGKMKTTINGEVIVDSWDVNRHYRVGNAQKAVTTSATATNNSWDRSTWDAASYGFYPLTPQIEFAGQSKNEISINLPVSADMTGTSSTNICVIIFRGLLIQNGSRTVQYKK